MTQLAISLIKKRLQDTYGRRLKFVGGSGTGLGGTGNLPVPSGSLLDGTGAGTENEKAAPASNATPFRSAGRRPERAGRPFHPDISLVRIIGEPTTPNQATTLAEEDKFQFQWWALGLVIFMTLALDRPFRGDLGVGADSYQLLVDQLRTASSQFQ